jgi:hypothetical protein
VTIKTTRLPILLDSEDLVRRVVVYPLLDASQNISAKTLIKMLTRASGPLVVVPIVSPKDMATSQNRIGSDAEILLT